MDLLAFFRTAEIAAPYPNPTGGHEWYHGTPRHYNDENGQDSDTESPPQGPNRFADEYFQNAGHHWNTDLGSHWSSLKPVAEGFAGAGPQARVAHARLHMANPKHYESEHDMAADAIHWAKAKGFRHLPEDEESQEAFTQDRADEIDKPTRTDKGEEQVDYGSHALTGTRSAWRIADIDNDTPGTSAEQLRVAHDGNDMDNYLAHHPFREEITQGFKKHLQDQGHDGVVYGNEYEGPKRHPCAIAFNDHSVKMKKWQHVEPTNWVKVRNADGEQGDAVSQFGQDVKDNHDRAWLKDQHLAAREPDQTWYRVHHPDSGWDLEGPSSSVGFGADDPDADHERGYSAFANPHDLHRYWRNREHLIGRGEVVTFLGRHAGWGLDRETTVVPTGQPSSRTSWRDFQRSISSTPVPPVKAHWHDDGWMKGNGASCTDAGGQHDHPESDEVGWDEAQHLVPGVAQPGGRTAAREPVPSVDDLMDLLGTHAWNAAMKPEKTLGDLGYTENRSAPGRANPIAHETGEGFHVPTPSPNTPPRKGYYPGEDLAGMDKGPKVAWVKLEHLKAMREYDRRDPKEQTFGSDDTIEQQKRELTEHGQREPGLISHDPHSDRARLIEGNHRIAAAEELGWPALAVHVVRATRHEFDGSQRHVYLGSHKVTADRNGYTPGNLHPKDALPDHMLYEGDAGLRPKTAAVWDGAKPEYVPAPEDASDDDRMAHSNNQREIRRTWEHETRKALSRGDLSNQQAVDNGYHACGHDSGSGRYGDADELGWKPMPHDLYHVTTDLKGALTHGLKSRRELGQSFGKGLGGGEDDTISFTDNEELAHHILGSMHEFHDVVNGRKTPAHMWDEAQQGAGAARPFHEEVARAMQSSGGPRHLDAVLHGRTLHQGLHTQAEMDARGDGKWSPHPETDSFKSKDGDLHNVWHRDATPDEKRYHATDMYKSFSLFRQLAGGKPDPCFFSTDTKGFAAMDPKNFGIVKAHPKPKTAGYQVSGMNEWRTCDGNALDLTHHKTARWLPRSKIFGPGMNSLDPRLFRADKKMHPEVASVILGDIEKIWGDTYPDWREWARVYLSGSEASEWWGLYDSPHASEGEPTTASASSPGPRSGWQRRVRSMAGVLGLPGVSEDGVRGAEGSGLPSGVGADSRNPSSRGPGTGSRSGAGVYVEELHQHQAPGRRLASGEHAAGEHRRGSERREDALSSGASPQWGESLRAAEWQPGLSRVQASGGAEVVREDHPRLNDDLDILIGIEHKRLRKAHPEFADMLDDDIDAYLTAGLRESFNTDEIFFIIPNKGVPEWTWAAPDVWGYAKVGPWHRTGYVNPSSWDIRAIKPYAAYDITRARWIVEPVHPAADWGPEKLPAAYWDEMDSIIAQVHAIEAMPEPMRTGRGAALYDYLHSDRRRAFGPHGTGVYDPGNAVWKALDLHPDRPLAALIDLKRKAANQIAAEATA